MPFIKQETIEAIKTRIPLEEVVGRMVQLKRSGRNWRGLSPFSQEKTPSFYVLPEKNIFKCFSTGLAGDVIRFVQETEKLEFTEAIETLAERYNIKIDYEGGSRPNTEKPSLKKEILEIHEYACDFFHRKFMEDNEEGNFIRQYWQQDRKFSIEIAKEFKIGWAPARSNDLNKLLINKKFSTQAIHQAGLFYESRGNRGVEYWRPRFRGRLMVPIRNVQGQVIAFTARQTTQTPADDPAREAKYVNSPETPVFIKGRMLFNLDRANRPAMDGDCFLMVEGQLDAIRCWEKGATHTVAPQGTGVTEEQLALLARYSRQLTMVLDGDRAGKEAALRILPLALRAELEVSFALLPDGMDPDTLLCGNTPERWDDCIQKAQSAMEFAVPALFARHPDTPTGKKEAFEDLFRILLASESAMVQTAYLEDAITISKADARSVQDDFEQFRSQRRNLPNRRPVDPPPPVENNSEGLTSIEGTLLWIVLQDLNWAQRLAQVIEHNWVNTQTIEGKVLAQILAEAEADAWDGIHQADGLLQTQVERDCLYAVYAEEFKFEDVESAANECLARMSMRWVNRELRDLSDQLSAKNMDPTAVREIFTRRNQLQRQKQALINQPPCALFPSPIKDPRDHQTDFSS